ncbi:hypothetical protein NDU88_003587 [Pleurodeles waltl]|uniref:Uncharacterized protein n=1 Tax=Pleurodeles waltl TaxID=8319 RepID=A0AAV7W6L5_PLEWA|nr:hypothetical protein NDU88_003587 [Pleurodeles waltl]
MARQIEKSEEEKAYWKREKEGDTQEEKAYWKREKEGDTQEEKALWRREKGTRYTGGESLLEERKGRDTQEERARGRV